MRGGRCWGSCVVCCPGSRVRCSQGPVVVWRWGSPKICSHKASPEGTFLSHSWEELDLLRRLNITAHLARPADGEKKVPLLSISFVLDLN